MDEHALKQFYTIMYHHTDIFDIFYNGSYVELEQVRIAITENDTITIKTTDMIVQDRGFSILPLEYQEYETISFGVSEYSITWIYKAGVFVTEAEDVEEITDALTYLFKP